VGDTVSKQHILGVGGMTCNGCANNVRNALSAVAGVSEVNIDLEGAKAIVNIDNADLDKQTLETAVTGAGYTIHEPGAELDLVQFPSTPSSSKFNWNDGSVWKQSAHNTKWCLIGCSIGEFGTLAYYSYSGIAANLEMFSNMWYFYAILPLINGLITSVMLETGILMRGQMDFNNALSTALGMSFISMLMMEIAMEITDLLFTSGELGMNPLAIPFMLVVGFLTPWPYNYWRLKKYGQACH
jgi:copper chaperone CopZ|tara:strand:- start:111 stop:833 length:723 start_codon:yes stop_codon:yes gene_type:complete